MVQDPVGCYLSQPLQNLTTQPSLYKLPHSSQFLQIKQYNNVQERSPGYLWRPSRILVNALNIQGSSKLSPNSYFQISLLVEIKRQCISSILPLMHSSFLVNLEVPIYALTTTMQLSLYYLGNVNCSLRFLLIS